MADLFFFGAFICFVIGVISACVGSSKKTYSRGSYSNYNNGFTGHNNDFDEQDRFFREQMQRDQDQSMRDLQQNQDRSMQEAQDQVWRDNTPFEQGGDRTDFGNSWNDFGNCGGNDFGNCGGNDFGGGCGGGFGMF